MTAVTIELDEATDSALRDRAAAENIEVEECIARILRLTTEMALELHSHTIWTPEAVAGVEKAEAELADGGGVAHGEVVERTRFMLGR